MKLLLAAAAVLLALYILQRHAGTSSKLFSQGFGSGLFGGVPTAGGSGGGGGGGGGGGY